jgi:uncharacterized protein YndB with AHSA1/START domain
MPTVTDAPRPGTGHREVRFTHFFEAPPETVFAAWTDPDQVARWWAPEGFEIPRDSVVIEPRVGGRFHLTMVVPGGEERHPLRSEFVELAEPRLIVMRAEAIPEAGIVEPTITRVELEPEGVGTRMTITAGPYTDEMAPSAEAGLRGITANLDNLLRGR